MKILVCISNVPDTTTKVAFIENDTKFNTAGVQYIINPYDELALTKALEITEKLGGTVTVIHVGLADSEASIRKALAIGANDAVRINASANDASFVAEQIANYAVAQNFDLIFTGRESIDYNGGMVCGLLAAKLKMPSVQVITSIEIDGGKAIMDRDIDGGKEKVSCVLPLVVSAQKELTEPRIPNMRGIMAARTKPLQVIEPTATTGLSETIAYQLPAAKGACKMIDPSNAAELIKLLHEEAKVI
jgi:electron transfer flavoprotein beta subunit